MKNCVAIAMIACGFWLLPGTTKASSTDTIYGSSLQALGRTVIDGQGKLALITSGAHFGFSFTGSECAVFATIADAKGHNYLQYELDGVYQKRVRIEGGPETPVIIKTTNAGRHQVWIYKTTEAHTGALLFSKIIATGVKNLAIPNLPIIEFIGNSITCGAAADASVTPCGMGEYHDHHNAYMAYGPSVARQLHVNFVLASVSGIGIYRTWNKDGPSMPAVFENLNFQADDSLKWNFKTYTPAIVSIALGTNDMSKGDGTPRSVFDTVRFVTDYVKFVQLVKSKYPQAKIALLSSPMIKDDSREILQRCLNKVKMEINASYPADKPLTTFFFNPLNPHGCSGHPDVADHQMMANELKPFFEQLLK
jgi:hypothetical protein